jgi:hypothetical protein
MIEKYRFGYIKIDGRDYTHDVEVRWRIAASDSAEGDPRSPRSAHEAELERQEVFSWWRKQSHVIDVKDIKHVLEQKPNLIIIGTGASGVAKVTEKAEKEIMAQNIELLIAKTGEAVRLFNNAQKRACQKQKSKKIIGFFHLTC